MIGVLAAIVRWFAGLFHAVFGVTVESAAERAGAALALAMGAFLRNLAASGVRNGAELVIRLQLINEGIERDHPMMSGAEKRDAFLAAARVAIAGEGADLAHEAVKSLLNTAAEIFHQPAVAERVGAPRIPEEE